MFIEEYHQPYQEVPVVKEVIIEINKVYNLNCHVNIQKVGLSERLDKFFKKSSDISCQTV